MLRKGVSTTALLALHWKQVTKDQWPTFSQEVGERKKSHLFKDEVMDRWINEFMDEKTRAEVKAHAEGVLQKPMWLPLATRTRFFRRTLANYVKSQGIKQVILLGSGCDTLPVRKTKYTEKFGVKFIEVDKATILDFKESIYNDSKNQVNHNSTFIKIDYVQDDLLSSLAHHGVDFNQPTFVMWEGNVFYLEQEQVATILSTLSSAFADLVVSFDYMHTDMLINTKKIDAAAKGEYMGKTLEAFRNIKAPFKSFFYPKEIAALADRLGFQIAEETTAAELAKIYQVDKSPFATAEPYILTTLVKGKIKPLATLAKEEMVAALSPRP